MPKKKSENRFSIKVKNDPTLSMSWVERDNQPANPDAEMIILGWYTDYGALIQVFEKKKGDENDNG